MSLLDPFYLTLWCDGVLYCLFRNATDAPFGLSGAGDLINVVMDCTRTQVCDEVDEDTRLKLNDFDPERANDANNPRAQRYKGTYRLDVWRLLMFCLLTFLAAVTAFGPQ
jgi:hypothetical protein